MDTFDNISLDSMIEDFDYSIKPSVSKRKSCYIDHQRATKKYLQDNLTELPASLSLPPGHPSASVRSTRQTSPEHELMDIANNTVPRFDDDYDVDIDMGFDDLFYLDQDTAMNSGDESVNSDTEANDAATEESANEFFMQDVHVSREKSNGGNSVLDNVYLLGTIY